jgi:hypothetical protein
LALKIIYKIKAQHTNVNIKRLSGKGKWQSFKKDSHLQAGKRKGVSELYRPATPYSFDFKNI